MTYTMHFLILMQIFTIVIATRNDDLPKFSSMLVFGDSKVDSGNNNNIHTWVKANHYPYGKDFPSHMATGRFSNGKLVTDFVASVLNLKDSVPAYSDPNVTDKELLTGVSFASGGSGLDDSTSFFTSSIPVSSQIEHFKDYIGKLKLIAGEIDVNKTLENALVVISAGSNDLVLKYDHHYRRPEFDINQYHDYLQNNLQSLIKELYDLGCRKFGVTGLPPLGCLPFQITAKFGFFSTYRKCVDEENSDTESYNRKLEKRLLDVQAMLPGSRVVYGNIYDPFLDLINHPEKYGFVETNRGCCGTGKAEMAVFCDGFTPICDDASKYVFWDSLHATEAAYKYIAEYLEKEDLPKFKS